MTQPVHGTVVARYINSQWRGVLIRGQSGSGKSSTALAMINNDARLVVDDQAIVWNSRSQLFARSPATIQGQIEVRGLGIIHLPYLDIVRVHLIVDATDTAVERLPDQRLSSIDNVSLPTLSLDLHNPVSALVVSAALETL